MMNGYRPDQTPRNVTPPTGGTGEVRSVLRKLKRPDGTEAVIVMMDDLANLLLHLGTESAHRQHIEPRRSFVEKSYRRALDDICNVLGVQIRHAADPKPSALDGLKAAVENPDA